MIKLKLPVTGLFLMLVIAGCKSCIYKLYQTNVQKTLNISVSDSKLKSSFVGFYIDSIMNKNKIIPDKIMNAFAIKEDDRVIYFENYPTEAYLITLSSTPCHIFYVYNTKYSDSAIGDSLMLPGNEMKRIENRFNNEVLTKAELYKEKNNLPDSVAFTP